MDPMEILLAAKWLAHMESSAMLMEVFSSVTASHIACDFCEENDLPFISTTFL
jgi:hypothetical protein